jgi:predicted phosphate transport protein (TIGR00153 family)
MNLIGSLFGRSPIGPMQRHMKIAVSCAREILPLAEAMCAADQETVSAVRQKIDELEHEADDIKHQIRSSLPRRLFMAAERRDLLEILDLQDSIADVAQDIAELAEMRSMSIPEGLCRPMLALVRCVLLACEQSERIINQLDELVETGFGSRETRRVEEMIVVLNQLESETDELAENAQRELFAMEEELGVGTYFWYQIINWIGDVADYAERVGNRLRLLIAN